MLALFREYNTNHGRWPWPDPAGLAAVSMTNPQTWNRYAYVGNMPLNGVDHLGLLGPLGDCTTGCRAHGLKYTGLSWLSEFLDGLNQDNGVSVSEVRHSFDFGQTWTDPTVNAQLYSFINGANYSFINGSDLASENNGIDWTWCSANLPIKWLGFAGMTAVVFGYAIRACRRSWGRQKFWLLLGFFFAVHSGIGVFVLMRVPTVPLVVYGVLTGAEYVILAAYLGFFLDSTRD